MQLERYIFMPKISLKPNRVTLFNEVLISDYSTGVLKTIPKSRSKFMDLDTFEEITFKKQFHHFKISSAAQKKIQEKINWLYLLAKSRYQKTYSGKEIFNFKINFLTLTLPSTQKHPTAQITNECFNQFLTEIRQRTKMENYVWRLEFQGNGNLHYHIVTDTYIDYFLAQKIWNRIINKLGYVDAYTAKFSAMSLQEYIDNVKYNDNVDFAKLAKSYVKNKRLGWTSPPSVDVQVCTSNKAISYYISKYFGKDKADACKCNALDNEQNSFSLRLWFCSRSLSALTSIVDYQECAPIDWFSLLKPYDKVKHLVLDYAQCLFFDIRDLSNYVKSLLYPVFRAYATNTGYCSAGIDLFKYKDD